MSIGSLPRSDRSDSTTSGAHATLMLAGGIAIQVVGKRLGHSGISTAIDLYVQPDDAQQRAASDTLGRLLSGGDTGL